jgi:hypothetical protein
MQQELWNLSLHIPTKNQHNKAGIVRVNGDPRPPFPSFLASEVELFKIIWKKIPFQQKMNVPKLFGAFLNGMVQKEFEGNTEITPSFLKENIFIGNPEVTVQGQFSAEYKQKKTPIIFSDLKLC